MTGAEVTAQTAGPDDTRRLAGAVAAVLRPGDVVSLTGELGAGKTCFVAGAAAAVGVTQRVTSPSFVLRHDYAGHLPDDPAVPLPVLHLDVYRLDRLSEVADLGYEEVTDGAHLTFVEWGDAMGALLPADHLEVELRLAEVVPVGVPEDDDAVLAEPRQITLRAHGDGWDDRLTALRPALAGWEAA